MEDLTNTPSSREAEVVKSAAGGQDPDREMGIRD